MGLFSSAAVVGDAGGGTLASVALAVAVVVALLVALEPACVPAVPLFAVFTGVHAATAKARNA
ncbi:MAG: hypothetical protein M3P29_04760 [Acidobacteriota bacterium]|nr:hypothetical protein [Acidobacteriota bacterium]